MTREQIRDAIGFAPGTQKIIARRPRFCLQASPGFGAFPPQDVMLKTKKRAPFGNLDRFRRSVGPQAMINRQNRNLDPMLCPLPGQPQQGHGVRAAGNRHGNVALIPKCRE